MMKSLSVTGAALLVTFAAAAVMADDFPAVPATPAPVFDLVSAQPFVLDQPYTSPFFKGGQQVTAGYVLVLSVDPALAWPRNSLMPVLYGGSSTLQPINVGNQSGKVIAILPSALTEQGTLAVDLATTPIWYGTPELPERVDAAKINGEKALAQKAGIKPFTAAKIAAATKLGGEQVTLSGERALLAHVAPLILQHSPQEKDFANQLQGILPSTDQTASTGKK